MTFNAWFIIMACLLIYVSYILGTIWSSQFVLSIRTKRFSFGTAWWTALMIFTLFFCLPVFVVGMIIAVVKVIIELKK